MDEPEDKSTNTTFNPFTPKPKPPKSSNDDIPSVRSKHLDSNMNEMIAKVTIETPSGSTTKYYMLYRDICFSPGSLLCGALGGVGLGFYSRAFFEQWRPAATKSWKSKLPFKIPELRMAMKFNGRQLSIPLLFGNTVWWRVVSRAIFSAVVYCSLECKLQGRWYRRSYVDCGAAGAVTGALCGFRGLPGGIKGSLIGATGFSLFALGSRFLYL